MGAAGKMAVDKENSIDKLFEYQGIQYPIVHPEGKRSFFRFVKIGFQSGRDKFEHEFENILLDGVVHEPDIEYFVKFSLFFIDRFIGEMIRAVRVEFLFK